MKAFDLKGRRGSGVTQHELAEKLGLYDQTLSDIENGKVDVTTEYYASILVALDALKSRETAAA